MAKKNCDDGRKKYNGAKKGRSPGEVQQLLDQARLNGDKFQTKVWENVLKKLKAEKDNSD